MKWIEKTTDGISQHLFASISLPIGGLLAMAFWIIDTHAWSSGEGFYAVAGTLVLTIVFTVLIDRIVYLYEVLLERRMQLLIDDDARLLPACFKTDRLKLESLKPEHSRLIAKLSADENVIKFVDDIPEGLTQVGARRWVLSHMHLERHTLRTTRIICLKETEEPIGGLVFISGHELEYWLLKAYRARGYAQEAIMGAFESLETEKGVVLFANTYEENTPSKCLLEKIGFNLEGKYNHKDHYVYDARR